MAKRLKKATELPDMANWTEEKIAHWLETHDTSEILRKAIQERRVHESAKKQNKKHISLRIEPAYIDIAKNIATRKGMGHQTLLRSLIIEGLARESKN
jgi:predicted DNA binding CopG/RHH family protein